MTSLLVVSTPREGGDEARRRYVEAAVPLIAGASGNPLRRLRVTEVLAGSGTAAFVFVADFDDSAEIHTLLAGAEYRALVPFRDAGFESMDIYVAENI
jgi:uncharacterized protein (DUF1330 family)